MAALASAFDDLHSALSVHAYTFQLCAHRHAVEQERLQNGPLQPFRLLYLTELAFAVKSVSHCGHLKAHIVTVRLRLACFFMLAELESTCKFSSLSFVLSSST